MLTSDARHPGAQQLLGYALVRQARYEDAVIPLDSAARTLQDAVLETQLAMVLRDLGRIDEAVAWLERAVNRAPPQHTGELRRASKRDIAFELCVRHVRQRTL